MSGLGTRLGYGVIAVGSIVLIMVSLSYPLGYGGYPHATLGLLVVLSAVGLVRSFATPALESHGGTDTSAEQSRAAHWAVLVYVGLGILYILSWSWIGTLPASYIFVALVSMLNGERRVWVILSVPAILTALLYLIFQMILYIPLPRGVVPL